MELASRLPLWTGPRIGRLRHHTPKPLRVPASYLETRPPENAPTITIVTPSFQQGRFLERTIYSILGQQYPRLEYVVQDGGSSDRTVDVLRRFEPYLTRCVSEPDDGQTDAINRGFSGTTGEIMAWVNSDDLLLPGCLAYVARFLVEHPDVDVVYGYRLMIDEDDRRIGTWITPPHDDQALTIADFVPQETLFWRRRVGTRSGVASTRASSTRSTGICSFASAMPEPAWCGFPVSSEHFACTRRRRRPHPMSSGWTSAPASASACMAATCPRTRSSSGCGPTWLVTCCSTPVNGSATCCRERSALLVQTSPDESWLPATSLERV